MFFSQSLVNFRLTVHESSDTPILSAVLYFDKNIANKTAFELEISGPFFRSDSFSYWNYFNTPKLRLQANKFNGYRRLVFNVSSDIPECSAGTRTFAMVPVKVYGLSLVGSFQITVYADARDLHVNTHHKHYVKAKGMVDSGKDNYNYYVMYTPVYFLYVFTFKTSGSLIMSSSVSYSYMYVKDRHICS